MQAKQTPEAESHCEHPRLQADARVVVSKITSVTVLESIIRLIVIFVIYYINHWSTQLSCLLNLRRWRIPRSWMILKMAFCSVFLELVFS